MREHRIVTAPFLLQEQTLVLSLPLLFFCYLILPIPPYFIYTMFFVYLFSFGLHRYVQYIEKNLEIIDTRQTTRLFPNEEGTFSLVVANYGKLPIVHTKCTFHTASSIEIATKEKKLAKNLTTFFISQNKQCRQDVSFSFRATKRGIFYIEDGTTTISDPFGLISIHRPIISRFHTEIVVYPTLLPVHGADFLIFLSGLHTAELSYYRDETSIVGVKQYERESFRSIHWTASAKMQSLQAKKFEMVQNKEITICLSLSMEQTYDWKRNMEDLISYTAFICTKSNLSFELFISVLANGAPIHIPMNTGTRHAAYVLEELARISDSHTLLSKDVFLGYCMRKKSRTTTLLIIGVDSPYMPFMHESYYSLNADGVVERRLGGAIHS